MCHSRKLSNLRRVTETMGMLLSGSWSTSSTLPHWILISTQRDKYCAFPFYKWGNWGRFNPLQGGGSQLAHLHEYHMAAFLTYKELSASSIIKKKKKSFKQRAATEISWYCSDCSIQMNSSHYAISINVGKAIVIYLLFHCCLAF